ncbi:hypothetical protein MTX20_21335 [Bradyrhizobium sp. ISRA435]|nr:hypothetical protein MTX20_21335 [Bradyrhizobium sp. ISRA435]
MNGVLVRTTIQENKSPIATAMAVPPTAGDQRVEQRLSDIRVGEHGEEVGDRQVAEAETDAVDHRIGVGKRAEQQHEDGIDDQEGQQRQQRRDPEAGERTATSALAGATLDFAAPVRLSVQCASPLQPRSRRAASLYAKGSRSLR